MNSENTNSDLNFSISYNKDEASNNKYNILIKENKLLNDAKYNKISYSFLTSLILNFIHINFDERD